MQRAAAATEVGGGENTEGTKQCNNCPRQIRPCAVLATQLTANARSQAPPQIREHYCSRYRTPSRVLARHAQARDPLVKYRSLTGLRIQSFLSNFGKYLSFLKSLSLPNTVSHRSSSTSRGPVPCLYPVVNHIIARTVIYVQSALTIFVSDQQLASIDLQQRLEKPTQKEELACGRQLLGCDWR